MNAPRSGSSHYTFRKQGVCQLQYRSMNQSRKFMEMVRQIVESEAKNDEDAE